MGLLVALFTFVKFFKLGKDFKVISKTILPDDYYRVLYVNDGDTIVVGDDNKNEYKVRLIGVDTPETVHPNKADEFFGDEAKTAMQQKLEGVRVFLERDVSQGEEDKYGRKLRYVYLDNGINLNEWLVKNGFAYEYTYAKPYRFLSIFKGAEDIARKNKRGLWSDTGYQDHLMDKFVDLFLKVNG